MAESIGIVGIGFLLQMETGTPGTYANIGEVRSVKGPDETFDLVDFTHSLSPNGRKEWKPGLLDGGSLVADFNYTLDAYNTLRDVARNRTKKNFQLVLPDTGLTTLTMPGYITGLPLNTPTPDRVSMELTIKIVGDITLTS